MKQEVAALVELVRTIPVGELPELIGDMERAKATAWTRLTMPASEPAEPDRLVSVDEAIKLLGCSKSFFYKRSQKFSFVRHQGRKLVCSLAGIQAHIKRSR